MKIDTELKWIFAGVFGVLLIATIIGRGIRHFQKEEAYQGTIENLNLRINAWWGMCIVLTVAVLLGWVSTVVLFGLISFFALREFIAFEE